MNSIKTILSIIESKAIDDGLKFQNQIDAEAQYKEGQVMREKEYSEWLSKQGFDVLRHANCCKIAFNGGWESRQTEVDELQEKLDASEKTRSTLYEENVDLRAKNDELQKRVDAVKGLAQTLWEKSEEKHQQGKVWESKTLGECADEILDVLEQALKGGSTPNLNTDENGGCRHFSTTMFVDGKSECFHCDAVVNEEREVIGKQSKGLNPFFTKTFSKEPK